jgi:hypothetical protein
VYYLQFTAESDNQFLLQSAGFTLTTKRKSQKTANYPKQILKVGGHIFWSREIAFLALMQLPPWPCTGTPFLPLWEQIDKCGDCAEPYRESCSVLHGAAVTLYTTAGSIEPRRNSHKNTLDFTLTARGTKRGRGVN